MTDLVAFHKAQRALDLATTVVEAREVRDKSEGLRVYARMAGDRTLEIHASEIRLRATRRLGEILAETLREKGRPKKVPGGDLFSTSLEELGINKNLSSRAQRLAAIPDREWEATIAGWRERIAASSDRVTLSLFARDKPEKTDTPPLPGRRYRVIYADPPWHWRGGGDRGADRFYPTMSADQIIRLRIKDVAAWDAALFLWTPGAHLDLAIEVISKWEFTYRTLAFVWTKQTRDERDRMGLGLWTRSGSEICLLATRGQPKRREGATDVRQILRAPVGEHSAKPPEAYERIERLLEGPYIELFARRRREGWDAWGNGVPGA